MKVPQKPPDIAELMAAVDPKRLLEIVRRPKSKYYHWDKLRHLDPGELSHAEWWLGIKLSRIPALRQLPLKDVDRRAFSYALPDEVVAMLHVIDRDASGRIAVKEEVTNEATRDRYIVSSLIEEAITSSQLEGASTTARVAKDMLRTGREPRDISERMILNNYVAMRHISDIRDREMTPELVLEIHRMVTDGTLDDAEAAGRLQRPEDPRVRVFDEKNVLLHTPPPASELPARLEAMCRFANEDSEGEHFIHPVVRAIILHFWLAYDHPFEDGNGRTARALFYWAMLNRGYWLAEFISISRILKKARAKYACSFLYTETDDNDLTYFLIYQLGVINRAIAELNEFLSRKVEEVRAVERLMRQSGKGLNHRQLALLSHALRNHDARYTMRSHGRSHDVVYETSRSDLLDLVARGLLTQEKVGKAFVFYPIPNLSEKIKSS